MSGHEVPAATVRHPATGAPIRVILADDDPIVRRLVRDVLQQAGVTVVAEAATGRQCIELTRFYRPDAVLVDLRMPEGDGLEVIRRVREALGDAVEVIVLTSAQDEGTAVTALRAGAVGWITKDLPVDQLPEALEHALRGEAMFSGRTGRLLLEQLRAMPEDQRGVRPVRSPLTPREWEVLDLLCAGLGTEDIAADLVVSTETVRSHVKNILRKLRVGSRAEAVALAPRLRAPEAGGGGAGHL